MISSMMYSIDVKPAEKYLKIATVFSMRPLAVIVT